tara:strand:- start:54 stop:893 length:840 start_codon:yes stop_codon:yes gene_type:complete
VENQKIVDYSKWNNQLTQLKPEYQNASPYPHIMLEDFLEEWAADKALEQFPKIKDEGWIHYVHVNERKHGLNKLDLIPPFIREVINELNTKEFISWLEQITGIDNLLPDDTFEGGGIHQSERGGYLNVHADFTVHPHKRNWRRRVNVLVYLNKNWEENYRGDLELWDRQMKECERKIAPLFNRVVIFNTDEDSYHGLPDPINCPEGDSRKSIALYYFTEEKELPNKRATNYRARPSDGFKAVFIWMDKQAIALYNWIKGVLGINDDFVSNILNKLGKKK